MSSVRPCLISRYTKILPLLPCLPPWFCNPLFKWVVVELTCPKMVKCKWRKIIFPWFYTVVATHKRWRKSDRTTQRQQERGSWAEAFEGSENPRTAKAALLLQPTLPEKILANNAFPLSVFCEREKVKKKITKGNKKISTWVVSFSNQLPFPRGCPVLMSTLRRLQAHSLMFSQSLQGQRGKHIKGWWWENSEKFGASWGL